VPHPLRTRVPFCPLEHFSCRCSAGLEHLWAFSAMKTPLHGSPGLPSNRRNALKPHIFGLYTARLKAVPLSKTSRYARTRDMLCRRWIAFSYIILLRVAQPFRTKGANVSLKGTAFSRPVWIAHRDGGFKPLRYRVKTMPSGLKLIVICTQNQRAESPLITPASKAGRGSRCSHL
jgi:hypothetical protein